MAAAEAPTASPVRSVNVEGVASAAIEQHASQAQADAAYRQAMAGAFADAKTKAEFLASTAGATLGAVQNIVEDSGYIECKSPEGSEYEGYEGEQPDFGNGANARVAPVAAARPSVGVAPTSKKKKKKKKKHPSAKTAAAVTCQVYAMVGLAYALS